MIFVPSTAHVPVHEVTRSTKRYLVSVVPLQPQQLALALERALVSCSNTTVNCSLCPCVEIFLNVFYMDSFDIRSRAIRSYR